MPTPQDYSDPAIAVPFGPDRDAALRTTPEFFQIRAQVYDLLHSEGQAVVDAEIAAGSR